MRNTKKFLETFWQRYNELLREEDQIKREVNHEEKEREED